MSRCHAPAISSVISVTGTFLYLAQTLEWEKLWLSRKFRRSRHFYAVATFPSIPSFFHLFLLSLHPTSHPHPSQQVISNSQLSTANNNKSTKRKMNKEQIEENYGQINMAGMMQQCSGSGSSSILFRPRLTNTCLQRFHSDLIDINMSNKLKVNLLCWFSVPESCWGGSIQGHWAIGKIHTNLAAIPRNKKN